MRLDGLVVGDTPAAWEALGFAVDGDLVHLGGVAIRLTGAGDGLTGWSVQGLEGAQLDGLPIPEPVAEPRDAVHPNGAIAVDHVVAVTDNLERTMAALAAAGGGEPRRIREVPGDEIRQAFYILETALLELVEQNIKGATPFMWGVTLVVEDLDALAARVGPLLGRVKDAVQPGRRIATLSKEAGCTLPLAFMTPR